MQSELSTFVPLPGRCMIGNETMMTESGAIFDIQRYSLHDGPGIRTVVFLKSCPLACVWCANPESQNALPELMLTSSPCLACCECERACPRKAIAIEPSSNGNPGPVIDWDVCDDCLRCASACVTGTLTGVGQVRSTQEILETIRLDQPFYTRSGGGVTLSGGEPTAQADFARAILEGCKRLGIHTVVETSGMCPWESLASLLPGTDLIYFDVKHLDPLAHERHTGKPNARILANLKHLVVEPVETIVRLPLVPGFNDDDDHLSLLAAFITTLERRLAIQLIPFHQLGSAKYQRLGRSYALRSLRPVDQEQLDERKEFLRSFGATVI